MNNKSKIIIGIIVILVAVFLIYRFFIASAPSQAPGAAVNTATNSQQPESRPPPPLPSSPQPPAQNSSQQSSATVTYTDQGFSPSTVTVKTGGTVKWVNNSSGEMWVASGVHPTHAVYSGTTLSQHCPDTTNSAFDECAGIQPGGSWSFTFQKTGTWQYHNHLNPSETGTVIVQ